MSIRLMCSFLEDISNKKVMIIFPLNGSRFINITNYFYTVRVGLYRYKQYVVVDW